MAQKRNFRTLKPVVDEALAARLFERTMDWVNKKYFSGKKPRLKRNQKEPLAAFVRSVIAKKSRGPTEEELEAHLRTGGRSKQELLVERARKELSEKLRAKDRPLVNRMEFKSIMGYVRGFVRDNGYVPSWKVIQNEFPRLHERGRTRVSKEQFRLQRKKTGPKKRGGPRR